VNSSGSCITADLTASELGGEARARRRRPPRYAIDTRRQRTSVGRSAASSPTKRHSVAATTTTPPGLICCPPARRPIDVYCCFGTDRARPSSAVSGNRRRTSPPRSCKRVVNAYSTFTNFINFSACTIATHSDPDPANEQTLMRAGKKRPIPCRLSQDIYFHRVQGQWSMKRVQQ